MRLQAVVAVAIGLLLGADTPGPEEGHGPLASLHGTWRLVSTADARHIDLGAALVTMTIGGDGRVVFKFGEVTTNRGTLHLGRDARGRDLDLRLANGQTVLGVYDRFGDDLVICCDETGKARPAGLEPTGTQWVERWRRVRP